MLNTFTIFSTNYTSPPVYKATSVVASRAWYYAIEKAHPRGIRLAEEERRRIFNCLQTRRIRDVCLVMKKSTTGPQCTQTRG